MSEQLLAVTCNCQKVDHFWLFKGEREGKKKLCYPHNIFWVLVYYLYEAAEPLRRIEVMGLISRAASLC